MQRLHICTFGFKFAGSGRVNSQEQVKMSVITAPCIVVFKSSYVHVLEWAQLDECQPDYVLLFSSRL